MLFEPPNDGPLAVLTCLKVIPASGLINVHPAGGNDASKVSKLNPAGGGAEFRIVISGEIIKSGRDRRLR